MIDGKLYLAGRSDFSPAKLYIQAGGFQVHADNSPILTGSIDELRIADRLGNIARKITLADGSVFETKDNDAIDSAFANSNQSSGFMGFVHVLERNMALAIFSIFITVGVVFSSFKWGLPAASHVVAHALPDAANQAMSADVLEFLDEHFLEETQLDEKQQSQLRQHFFDAIVPLYQAEDMPEFKLHFRLWPLGEDSIPNALALPSGDIVVTDRFIELAQTQDEIDIVLLHEMGHVVERHSLERVIEGSAIVIVVSMAFGDVSWLADMGVGLGSFLISSFYSRGHEAEADRFAYEHSLQAGINPASLGLILNRMEQDMLFDDRDSRSDDEMNNKKSKPDRGEISQNENNSEGLSGYFSTHPSSADRAAMGKRYQACFEQGLTFCPMIEQQ
ncbi:MAG: M48 family metallopeptidase [Methylophagaceae bacterium]